MMTIIFGPLHQAIRASKTGNAFRLGGGKNAVRPMLGQEAPPDIGFMRDAYAAIASSAGARHQRRQRQQNPDVADVVIFRCFDLRTNGLQRGRQQPRVLDVDGIVGQAVRLSFAMHCRPIFRSF